MNGHLKVTGAIGVTGREAGFCIFKSKKGVD